MFQESLILKKQKCKISLVPSLKMLKRNLFPPVRDAALGRGFVKCFSLVDFPLKKLLAAFVIGLEMNLGPKSNNVLWGCRLISLIPIN